MTNKRSPILNAGLLFALTCLALYMSACAYIWQQQDRFIFMPQRPITRTPADLNLPFEEIYLPARNKSGATERIHAWFMPTVERSAQRVLLYLHGSALNIGANIAHAERFAKLGFSVLLLSYRGYGKSDGDFPSEESVYADAETGWNYLVTERKFAPASVFIYGHSLGGAVAIHLASNHSDAGGIIVEGTFTSIAEMARLNPPYRILPLDLIINQRFDSVKKVGYLDLPVLYIHGKSDETVPFEMSKELFDKTSSAKKLTLIAGGGHNNTAAIGGEQYLNAVRDFIRLASDNAIKRERRD